MDQLVELDALEILVIVDNELDPLSPCPNPAVKQSGGVKDMTLREDCLTSDIRGSGVQEFRMHNICCGAHGLSLMVTGIKGDQKRTLLFDTGPEEAVWERNSKRLRADIRQIETIALSHWHRDHSGGMLKVLGMVKSAQDTHRPVDVDLHPDRPDYRGVQPPGLPVFSLEADPTFEEIEAYGGTVRKNDQDHAVLDNTFLISGKIPRVTEYEKGLKFGVRFDAGTKVWSKDEEMADDRTLMCRLKGELSCELLMWSLIPFTGKGIVVISGCGHAGVVNSAKHAVELGGGTPLYAVVGGFHLADAQPALIQRTVEDLKSLDIQVLLAGHCTGWRAKVELQQQMPGRFAPCFVGSKFVL